MVGPGEPWYKAKFDKVCLYFGCTSFDLADTDSKGLCCFDASFPLGGTISEILAFCPSPYRLPPLAVAISFS